MYQRCTDVWVVYICIGHEDISGDVLGAYRCMGDVHMSWTIQTYGGMYWGHTNVQEGIQMYGGMYRCKGMYKCGGHTETPRHTDSQTYPHMPGNYTWALSFL